MLRRSITLIMLVTLVLLIAGCDAPATQSDNAPTNIPPATQAQAPATLNTTQPASPQQTMQLTTYQASKDAQYLVPEYHTVAQTAHPAQAALELLVSGPKNPDLVAVVPAGTKVLEVSIHDHVAYANFSEKLIKNNHDGATAEMLLVVAIVDTLTQFPEIDKVQILVNSKKIDTISGHMDLSEPLGRSEQLVKIKKQ
ncbi:MAG: gerM [Firmicutes bacterium]|nr:gerM [Bacillota bacterium]